jgi:hypothetical protein
VQLIQQPCGSGHSFPRIEGVADTKLPGNRRHELRDTERTRRTDSSANEPALLPNKIDEKTGGQRIFLGRRHEQIAKFFVGRKHILIVSWLRRR